MASFLSGQILSSIYLVTVLLKPVSFPSRLLGQVYSLGPFSSVKTDHGQARAEFACWISLKSNRASEIHEDLCP